MAFSYTAGTATPGFGGLIEFPSLRINQGTFRPLSIPPLTQTPPLKFVATPVPRGGSIMSEPSFDVWEFDVTGFFDVNDPNDVQAGIDYLKSKINTFQGAIGITLNGLGWSAARTMTVKVAGQLAVEDPPLNEKKLTRRSFAIHLVAEDPIQYASTQTITPVTSSTSVPNLGNADVPYIAHFDGPNTTYIQVVNALGKRVGLQYSLGSGQWAEVSTKDGLVLTNTGVDLYQYVTMDDEVRKLPAGGLTLSMASGGGGSASVKSYDGWI